MIRATQTSAAPDPQRQEISPSEFIKGPYLDLGKDRERFAERIYEAALQYYLQSGAVDEKLQREMIAVAAQRIKPKETGAARAGLRFQFRTKSRGNVQMSYLTLNLERLERFERIKLVIKGSTVSNVQGNPGGYNEIQHRPNIDHPRRRVAAAAGFERNAQRADRGKARR